MKMMKIKKIALAVLVFACMLVVASPLNAKADDYYDYESYYNDNKYGKNFVSLGVEDKDEHVFDGANFYNEEQEEKLEKLCKEISEEFDTDVIIATINGYSGSITSAVVEIENARYGGKNKACANMLIVDIGSRDIRVESIEGPKSNDNWMESKLCDYIYEEIADSFTKKRYYDGTKEYLELLEKYLPASSSYNPKSVIHNPLAHLGLAVVISAIIVASQVASAGGKVTVSEKDYLQLGGDHRVDKRDIFLRKTITKTRIQSSSGGSGGSGGGGGGGRGGGGGKF